MWFWGRWQKGEATSGFEPDVLVNEVLVDAFSRIIPPEKAHDIGEAILSKLKEEIPRQLFQVPLQAAVGAV